MQLFTIATYALLMSQGCVPNWSEFSSSSLHHRVWKGFNLSSFQFVTFLTTCNYWADVSFWFQINSITFCCRWDIFLKCGGFKWPPMSSNVSVLIAGWRLWKSPVIVRESGLLSISRLDDSLDSLLLDTRIPFEWKRLYPLNLSLKLGIQVVFLYNLHTSLWL